MLIKNGFVLNGQTRRFERKDIKLENGLIGSAAACDGADEIFDAMGLYVIPGFIDTHIHGCVGVEFASDNEDFTKARKWLASEGTTSFAATVRALPCDRVVAAIKNIVRESKRELAGASVAGINLEGRLQKAVL